MPESSVATGMVTVYALMPESKIKKLLSYLILNLKSNLGNFLDFTIILLLMAASFSLYILDYE